MTQGRPPGWYDEPGGDRASLRWWDGRAWTSVTRERSSAEALPVPRSVDVLDSGPPPRTPVDRRALAGAAAAVVLLIALVVAVLPGRGDDTVVGGPQPGPTLLPSTPAPTTAVPVSGRITDRVARLSYDVLPGDWREWDRESFDGLRSTLGYYRVTQEDAPNQQTYWANVNSGPVDDATVRPDLAGTARELVDTLSGRYYPAHTRTGLLQRALTVDGAPAYLIRYRAVFDPADAAGYSAATEQVAVLLVDVGQPFPSALYLSLPDTVEPLWNSIDGLLAGVRVIR